MNEEVVKALVTLWIRGASLSVLAVALGSNEKHLQSHMGAYLFRRLRKKGKVAK